MRSQKGGEVRGLFPYAAAPFRMTVQNVAVGSVKAAFVVALSHRRHFQGIETITPAVSPRSSEQLKASLLQGKMELGHVPV